MVIGPMSGSSGRYVVMLLLLTKCATSEDQTLAPRR
jgi:hypothetical protein